MRKDPTVERSEFASYVGVPPYARGVTRFRKGLKHTAFYPVIGRAAKEFKLHNSYLKPDQITDPLDEYWTLRKIAGLWDVTGEEVIEIAGPDALAVMNELIPRDLARAKDGQCLYAVMCYDYGGIVEDAVLIRFSPEKIWWVGGPGHSEQWIYANSLGRRVTVTSYLDDKHVASLQGPKSREILQRVTDADLSRVPFYHSVEAKVCGVPDGHLAAPASPPSSATTSMSMSRRPGRCSPISGTRAGPTASSFAAAGPWACAASRRPSSISARISIGSIRPSTSASAGWSMPISKGFFHGREVLTDPAAREPEQHLAGLRLEGQEAAFIGDPVLVEGRPVGQVTSASISPSLEASIAIAMLDRRAAAVGQRVTVRLDEKPVAGEVVPMPFFDPERKLSKV